MLEMQFENTVQTNKQTKIYLCNIYVGKHQMAQKEYCQKAC